MPAHTVLFMPICPLSLGQRHGHRGLFEWEGPPVSPPHCIKEEMGARAGSHQGYQKLGGSPPGALCPQLTAWRQGCFICSTCFSFLLGDLETDWRLPRSALSMSSEALTWRRVTSPLEGHLVPAEVRNSFSSVFFPLFLSSVS